jgi:serine/threonine protein kinase
MIHRFLCLQGHLWAFEEEQVGQQPQALFCPTCGTRLHPEDEAPTIPVNPVDLLKDPLHPPSSAAMLLSFASFDGPSSAAPIQPSDIEEIPGYELLGILGRGGMGIVFRARQVSLKRQVALKMILTGRHARPLDRARFQKEAESVARLQHPNIVQIYEVGHQNGLPYCSLEFVNAGSLSQFLGSNPQPARPSALFVLEIARAMQYAHTRGIVHRDLKPANILMHLEESRLLKMGQAISTSVLRDLGSYMPKISDFGLAKHIEGGEERPSRHGTFLGTPSYMAPEQANGPSSSIGPKADVYALGAILYEMLTGRPPFLAATQAETAQLVVSQEPTPVTQLQPKVPKDLETICLTCLMKDPAKRYESAESLAEDLRRFLDHEPIHARRTGIPERAWKLAKRRPMGTVALIGTIVVSALLFVNWHRQTVALRGSRDLAIDAWQTTQLHLHGAMHTVDALVPPGAAPRPRLQRAADFYRDYVRQCADAPTQERTVALAVLRLSDLQERLDDPQEAQRFLRDAQRRLQRWCERFPQDQECLEQLQRCRKRLEEESRQASGSGEPVPR